MIPSAGGWATRILPNHKHILDASKRQKEPCPIGLIPDFDRREKPMCTRYTLQDLALAAFHEELAVALAEAKMDWQPRYNVAPAQQMPVVIRRTGALALEKMTFGLTLPGRTDGERPKRLANARAETLLIKPAFRDAARRRRCLVPADGFYEWERADAGPLPHYFYLREHRPFFFAGIWQPKTAATPAAFAIVTTAPNALLRPVHDRMPVLLGPHRGPAWLDDPPLAPARLAQLCRPLPADLMAGHRVDPRVNRVSYEAADCVASIPG
jgi:putative SOS response-associated peptidase YedK